MLLQHFLLVIIIFTGLAYFGSCLDRELHANDNSARRKPKSQPRSSSTRFVVNVDNFGAKADGTDDTQAFMKAWDKACSTKGSLFLVPLRKVYHLKQISFEGPCESDITMRIQGKIRASTERSDYEKDPRVWIKFENLINFNVDGGGVISGNGQVWWPKSCKIDKSQPCVGAPTAVTFSKCTNLKVTNVKIKNAQQMHLTFHECSNVEASNLKVKSPGKSPNTDGIHVTGSTNVQILNSDIGTGDDCISIVSGSDNVRAMGIKCGPGHGISIGSLGKDGAEDRVSNVLVSGVRFTGTTNGVRIKSWQGGRGYAKNIVFQNIRMQNVTNPIIIDQFYCDKKGHDCKMQKNAVHIENVLYKNIIGTSASDEGVIFQCSEAFPCEGVKMQNVQIKYNGRSSVASCSNVNVQELGANTPKCPKH
ncbi:OLC1v1001483C1 [Oldenlandia corymbosa var. corymbosa]|uniref:endo-polygalacturonase n=1 Tax=Oldenlandia corymbosa var. corymbosa TaxID=529605 RepID=A0AAV1D5L5_OLDCO|nr:OLC1v1001483C1 [Oldenlandia corymbosa var. corymbosa]